MVLQYLSGERIQGSSEKSRYTLVGSNATVSGEKLNIPTANNDTRAYRSHAITDDANWVADFDVTTGTGNTGHVTHAIVFSEGSGRIMDGSSNDGIALRLNMLSSSELSLYLQQRISGTNTQSTFTGTNFDQSTTYYMRMVRNGTALTLKVYTSDAYRTAGSYQVNSTQTLTLSSPSVRNIAYIQHGSETTSSTVSGVSINAVKIYHGITTVSSETPDFQTDFTDEKASLVTSYSSSMGSGANGTAISDPTFVAEGDTNGVAMPSGFGSGAKSMYFDGDDAININGAKDFSASSGTVGTISFWYYNTGTQEGKTILQFGDESASQYMTFETRESGNDCIVCHNQDGTGSSGNNWEIRNAAGDAGASLATSTWHHCVASQNGTAVVCYIDGEELTTWNNQNDKSEWILSGIDNVRIGCRNNNDGGEGGFITGNITEVAFWNVALSETQVDSLFGNGGSTAQKATTIPTGLRAYYDGSSLTNNLADYSDIPVGTRFEETDSRKIYRMKDGAWVLKGVTA